MDDIKITIALTNRADPIKLPTGNMKIIDWGIETDSEIFWCYINQEFQNGTQTFYCYYPLCNIEMITSNVPIDIWIGVIC